MTSAPSATTRALAAVIACIGRVNDRQFQGLETVVDPDIEVAMVPGFGPARTITGIGQVQTFLGDAARVSVSIEVEPSEIKLAGADAVVVHADYVLRSQGSEDRLPVWIVYRLREGRVWKITPFLDPDEAWAHAER